jgi:tetratricopeptide (TPR) repeat protein
MHALLAELAAIRSGRPWIALAAGAVGVVAGGVAVALAASRIEPPVDRCAAALAQLTDAYSPEIESSLSGVLARAPKVQTEQLAKLRGFVASWRKAHLATCRAEAPGAQDPTVALCLDARRLEIASSVRDVIAAGPEQAIHAPRITKVIVDPETCATPAPSLLFARVPADPELDRTVTALRYRLAEARDAFDREDFGRALELAQPVAEAAKVWPLLRVDAEVGVGACQRRLGDTKAAQATLRDALALAEGIHYDDFAVSVWIELAAMMTYDLHDAARGLEYIEHADTASAPGARPAKLTVELELVRGTALIALNRRRDGEFALHKAVELARAIDYHDVSGVAEELGYVHESEGRYTEAIAVFRNTAEQAPRAPSGVIIGHAAAFGALAVNLARLGKLSEAEATARQAVEIADRMYREARPMRTTVHLALAAVLEQVGDHAEALAEAAVAVTTMARLQGERSLVYAEAAQVEGDLLLDGRRYRGAELLLARSCEIRAFAQGDDGPELAGCETSHGAALIGLHRSAEALAELDRAVDSLTRSHQGPHPDLANALVVRGIAHAALGHHRQAGADFARAIAMLSSSELEPGALARAKWRLGALRWPADRAAARAEVTAALALFQTANPPWAAERSDAAAWLARHDRR